MVSSLRRQGIFAMRNDPARTRKETENEESNNTFDGPCNGLRF